MSYLPSPVGLRVKSKIISTLRAAEGGPVNIKELAQVIWGDDEDGGPLNVVSLINNYVWQLRRAGFPVGNMPGRGFYYATRYPGASREEISASI